MLQSFTPSARMIPMGAMIALSLAGPALGDVVLASRTLRPGEIITARDLQLAPGLAQADMIETIDTAVGLETRVAIYRGRPVRLSEIGAPTLVHRNDIVEIVFQRGSLALRSEGRALDAGALGERVRVMNLDSRVTIYGSVRGSNLIEMN
ncbi:MAG: flagellar basal body P-ring formation chaperone FlgA [Neomegalonema sp.]|nr:flagellar basal body P-ring formation chaperone FlgA [Neomegalonema sp.]